MEEEDFEAVFIGSGAGLPMFMGIPGETANGVFSANEYLTRSNLMKAFDDSYDTPIAAGKKVAVVGGGNVAMDAARTALRLGASEYEIELDTVIMSLGTSPNPLISSTTKGLETNKRKCIVAEEENGQTSKAAVFAGGDAVTGAATVILAMGAGKAAAKGIDEFLSAK